LLQCPVERAVLFRLVDLGIELAIVGVVAVVGDRTFGIGAHGVLLLVAAVDRQGVNAWNDAVFRPLDRASDQRSGGLPIRITCSRRGPCAPRMRVCSMSAERDGPVIRLSARGIVPSPNLSRSRPHTDS